MKHPFRYYGSKGWLVPHIMPILQRCSVYHEPFGGSLAVMLAMPKLHFSNEIVGDTNGLLVNFFRSTKQDSASMVAWLDKRTNAADDLIAIVNQLRSVDTQELKKRLQASPDYCEPDIAAAYFFFMACAYPNRSSVLTSQETPSIAVRNTPVICRDGHPSKYTIWAAGAYAKMLPEISHRLEYVTIVNQSWRNTVDYTWTNKNERNNSQTVRLYFIDPPYGQRENEKALDHHFYTHYKDVNNELMDWAVPLSSNPHTAIVYCAHRRMPLLEDSQWQTLTLQRGNKKSIDTKTTELIYLNHTASAMMSSLL